jgi:hypothetical protein
MARVWKNGTGMDQSMNDCHSDYDEYCKMHGKEALEGTIPCVRDANLNKVGLFMGTVSLSCNQTLEPSYIFSGRIDQWQDGEEGIAPYKDANGFIQIEWQSPEMRKRVEIDLRNGHQSGWGTGEGKQLQPSGLPEWARSVYSPTRSEYIRPWAEARALVCESAWQEIKRDTVDAIGAENGQYDVFLSCRFQPSIVAAAKLLKNSLDDVGISAYLADVNVGDDICEEVVFHLEHAKLMIILGTKNYGEDVGHHYSSHHELHLAQEMKKPLFPLLMLYDKEKLEHDWLPAGIYAEWWEPR